MQDFEKEILGAASIDTKGDDLKSFESGCRSLQLLFEDETLVALRTCEPWKRGGAESFITAGVVTFTKRNKLEFERKIILKAYCGFGYSPARKVEIWQERSKVLARYGIPISRVYSVFRGVLFAEFIESSLLDFLVANAHDSANWAAKNLRMLVDPLDSLKAHPISLLPDLRTDGSLIYIVDFGEDLGEIPGTDEGEDFCRLLVRKELFRYGFGDIATLL